MSPPKVYADLQKRDARGRIILSTVGTREDLERLGLTLENGLALVLWADDADDAGARDDLLVDAVVRFDAEAARWVAEADWSTVRRARHGSGLLP